MPERFDSYLAQVDEQIRWPRVRPALRRELMGHLEEQRDACLADGMDEPSAELEAVRQMGDPVLIGQQLDAVHRPRPQYASLLLAAILAICGALIRIHIGGASPARSIAAAALGFLLLLGAYFSDYRRLVRYGGWLYLATVVLGYTALNWWFWIFQSGRPFQYVSLFFPLAGTLAACALRGKRWGFWLAGLAYGLLLWLSYQMTYALAMLLVILCGAMTMLAAIRQNWWPVRKKPAAALVITVSAAALAALTWARWDTLLFALGMDTQYYYPFTFSDTVVRQVLELAPNWGSADLPLGLTQSFEYLNFTSDASDYLLTLLISQLGRIPFLLLCGAFVLLLILLCVRCLRQLRGSGGMLAAVVFLTLAAQFVSSVLFNCGIRLFVAYFPFVMGNLNTVIDLALLGVALSVFRQTACPEDVPQTPSRA